MKIQFGTERTPRAVAQASILSSALFSAVLFNSNLQFDLGESQRSAIHSRGLNVTHASFYFYCELPYEDCLCTVLWNRSNTSETCVTYGDLTFSRTLSLISFLLEITLVRALFSLHTAHRRVIIYFLWIASIFVVIIMIIGLYRSSCFQVYTTTILFCAGAVLGLLGMRNLLKNRGTEPSVPYRNINVSIYPSERTNEITRCWL